MRATKMPAEQAKSYFGVSVQDVMVKAVEAMGADVHRR